MEVETLKKLALMGATRDPVNLSSTILGSSIGTSPQTAARRLVELEDEGYITRTVTNEGQKIRLTEKGILRLKAEYMEYKELFDKSRLTSIKEKSRPAWVKASTIFRWADTGTSSSRTWALTHTLAL